MRSEKLNVSSLFICTRTNGLVVLISLNTHALAEKRRELEIHINFVPRNERLAVLVLDEQAAHGRGERERIDFHLLNGDFAVELLGNLFHRHAADDGRQNQETDDGVKEQQPDSPERELAFARRERIPETAPS